MALEEATFKLERGLEIFERAQQLVRPGGGCILIKARAEGLGRTLAPPAIGGSFLS